VDVLNDTGVCFQSCNQLSDCVDPDAHCEPFVDPAAAEAFGAMGLCLPNMPDAGAADSGTASDGG
jgi:hypothetical protein